ncbi:MAG: acetyl-CoA C-acetyltransferase [Candidatus Eiseniibacteriota bacterium]
MSFTAVVVSGARTPIGKFLGGLAPLTAPKLGGIAIAEAMKRAGLGASDPEEVIMGHVVQGGAGQAPARQAQIAAGIDPAVGALTVNKVCGSGLKAVMLAAQAIRAGDAKVVVAGGMESMSNVPHYLYTGRTGVKLGDTTLVDGVIKDGLWCSFNDCHMGGLAEFTAENSKIGRDEQDRFAVESHRKAAAAMKAGKFKKEIVCVHIPQRKGDPVCVADDEPVRPDTTIESLAKLPSAFQKGGTVTAGNAPGLNDGAAALVVMEEQEAKRRSLKPLARITGYATGGGDPKMLFYAPVVAVKKLLALTGRPLDSYDLIEANEAFAVQALADGKELGWDWNRVNVNGGAVALGHPIGASGARVLVSLLHAMEDRGARSGLATLCLGGGNAVALAVERPA